MMIQVFEASKHFIFSDIEGKLNRAEANSEHRREKAQERYIRNEQDCDL